MVGLRICLPAMKDMVGLQMTAATASNQGRQDCFDLREACWQARVNAAEPLPVEPLIDRHLTVNHVTDGRRREPLKCWGKRRAPKND